MDDAYGLDLQPERDVVTDEEGRHVAIGHEPWLTVTSFDPRLAGRIIEIIYKASLLDEPVRPVFRFRQDDAEFDDRLGAGPIVGAAIWIGRVPPRTRTLSVSPTHRVGIFAFRIERIRRRSWLALIGFGFLKLPNHASRALALRLAGFVAESDAALAAIVSATPMSSFDEWASSRRRIVDPNGLDKPRFDWRQLQIVCLVRPGLDPAKLARTCTSLRAQVFPHWSAALVEAGDCPDDPRFKRLPAMTFSTALFERLGEGADACLVCVLTAGDALAPEAFMVAAEQAHRNPLDNVFYGDVTRPRPNGSQEPLFAPGWCPLLQRRRPFLRRPIFVRASHLVEEAAWTSFVSTGLPPNSLLQGGARPLRRVLAIHGASVNDVAEAAGTPSVEIEAAAKSHNKSARSPLATIIIPTRDQPALLRRAIDSICRRSRFAPFEIIVLNNGGSHEETRAALASLGSAPDVALIDFDGAFNFSAICNAGCAASRGEILLFLNDDTEVLSDGWLDRLVGHALHPDVGAVGARLTYPDGRLQHIGMVMGMNDTVGHFGANGCADAPGWARRNESAHEVCAVTGACLAVARSKFDAVGGFDAHDLPVEFGDVDLCLKLRVRGWKTLVDPDVHIMHAESASRGRATFRPLAVHAKERAVFRERWRHVLRDDPFFHPGLSLHSLCPALG